jgi:hypothetical protein
LQNEPGKKPAKSTDIDFGKTDFDKKPCEQQPRKANDDCQKIFAGKTRLT